MSQTAVMIMVNGSVHSEVYEHVPDYDEAIQICKDFGYESEDGDYPGDHIRVEYEWLEIGEGESGTDAFFSDDELVFLYNSGHYEENFKTHGGYDVECVESGNYNIEYYELDWVPFF